MKHGQGHIVYKRQGWVLNPDVSGSRYTPHHHTVPLKVMWEWGGKGML